MAKYPWKKLFVRKDCDLPTSADAIHTAYDILWDYSKNKREYVFLYFKNGNFNYYIHDIDEFTAARGVYKRYFFTPTQIKKARSYGLKIIKSTQSKAGRWKSRLNSELNIENLALAFADFRKDFELFSYKYSILPWWALESWQHDFLEIIHKLIKQNKLEKHQDKILASVLQPWKGTAISEIQRKFKAGVGIDELAGEYQFLRSWTVVWYKPINADWIGSICKKTVLEKEKMFSVRQVSRLLKPNAAEKLYFAAAPYVIFFKDWRDDLRRKQVFVWSFLWDKLAEYFNVEHDDFGYLTLNEIDKILEEGGLDMRIIESRKKFGCVVTTAPKEFKNKILDQGNFEKYLKIIVEIEKKKSESVIKGIIAQSGKVNGKVIVVRHYKDVFRVSDGDILVANTTHPNYLLGMKKAAAFVTDEGGIASHAAIVAREMKKPCIVGTKFATKVLKDGDLVEVDAEKGIVKKL